MSEQIKKRNNLATLRNVASLMVLIQEVQDREAGLPGMATFYGPSGFGKTIAATMARNYFEVYYIEVMWSWTPKYFCEMLLRDMGIKPAKTLAPMIAQIAEELAKSERILLVDEADQLVARNKIEMLREIHQCSDAPVILIGEELLPQKLQKYERIHGRMMKWVAAQPADMSDLKKLKELYHPNTDMTDDLLAKMLTVSNGSPRRIRNSLNLVDSFAKVRGLDQVTLKNWGKTPFAPSDAPAPRGGLK